MIGPLHLTPCQLRLAGPVLASIVLLGCDIGEPPSDAATTGSTQFADVPQGTTSSRQTDNGADRNTSAPGVGMRQNAAHGANAGQFGLQMVLQSLVAEDGTLVLDRLDSSMNMDLLRLAIGTYSETELPGTPREQLVFYCNAYNANAIAILTMFAMDSDRDDLDELNDGSESGAPFLNEEARARFDAQPVMVAGIGTTMAELRDSHILGFGDPRVLAYLIDLESGSVRLPREALTPRRLDDQLDGMCATWVNAGKLARFEDGELRLSPLLTRHVSAFEGEVFGGVIGFLEHYAEAGGPVAAALAQSTSQPEPEVR